MSQNDFTIANQTFPNTRADINSALQALASTSSGSSEPSTTFANQLFYNTTSNLLQIRNEDNDAFITIAELDQTNDTVEYVKSDSVRTALIEFTDGDDALAIADGGALTVSTSLDMNGTELILDADADTSITADTDDRIDLRVGGTDRAFITNNTIGGIINRVNAKPFIINGNFAIAQRGTSADGTSAYLLDRWKKNSGTTANVTVSQDTDAPTGFINSQKMLASGASSFFQTGQQIEYKNFYPLLGKATSLSFYYKSDVDVIIRIRTGTSTADSVVLFTGGVASTATATANASWTNYVHNFTLASNVTSLSIEFATGTLANTDFVYLAGVQLEQGTYDTTTIPPFQHESYGDNLARCQRYHFTTGDRSNYMFGRGFNNSTTEVFRWGFMLPVEMRASPSNAISGTVGLWNGAVAGSATLGTSYNTPHAVQIDLGSSGTLNDLPGGIGMMFLNTGRFSATAEF
jgi:hypothetical protein